MKYANKRARHNENMQTFNVKNQIHRFEMDPVECPGQCKILNVSVISQFVLLILNLTYLLKIC